jgi:hypothetical protein
LRVDTLEWYYSYCGECIIKRPDTNNHTIKFRACQTESGYELIDNAIIYKQNGKYFMLNFDCMNIALKKQLIDCKSLAYFISIIPVLYERDKQIKSMEKKGRFPYPMQADGGFQDAYIYLNNSVHHVYIQDEVDQDRKTKQTGNYWLSKEFKLADLISADITKGIGKSTNQ